MAKTKGILPGDVRNMTLVSGLDALKTFVDPFIVQAMEVAETLVVNHAKANHEAAPKDGSHPSARYYDRTGNLTNTIRQGEVVVNVGSVVGTVLAGGARAGGSVNYAEGIETGTARSRAYPFFLPALEENHGKILSVLGEGVRRALR